jgi:threonine/homoserine/homoserine lactone efflux protein
VPAAQPVTVGGGGTEPSPRAPAAAEPHVARRSFTMGITSQLLNVKVVIFYVSFVPQFVTPGDGAAARTAALAATFIGLATLWWAGYILLVDRLHPWLTRPRVLLAVERLTGLILIVLAVRLAVSR